MTYLKFSFSPYILPPQWFVNKNRQRRWILAAIKSYQQINSVCTKFCVSGFLWRNSLIYWQSFLVGKFGRKLENCDKASHLWEWIEKGKKFAGFLAWELLITRFEEFKGEHPQITSHIIFLHFSVSKFWQVLNPSRFAKFYVIFVRFLRMRNQKLEIFKSIEPLNY